MGEFSDTEEHWARHRGTHCSTPRNAWLGTGEHYLPPKAVYVRKNIS